MASSSNATAVRIQAAQVTNAAESPFDDTRLAQLWRQAASDETLSADDLDGKKLWMEKEAK